MDIKIIWSFEAKREDVKGSIAVVVDVWAATTNIALMLAHGAKELILVREETIRSAINQYPGAFIVGESTDEKTTSLFTCSNSPSQVNNLDVTDKTVLYMTNNGTKVIEKALLQGADPVMTAAFVNISSVAQALRMERSKKVCIIASGEQTIADKIPDQKAWEDYYCAQTLCDLINTEHIDCEKYIKKSKEFIKSHYRYQGESLQIVHRLDSISINPFCITGSDGLILIKTESAP